MPVSIISNLSSSIAQRNITKTDNDISRSLSKLSSGQRVFSAEEDAASLAVGAGLAVDVSSYRAAQINVASGSSMLQIADGSLGQISDILIRMKTLSSQAVSGQLSNTERSFIDAEYQGLLSEIDRISSSTEFNGVNLLGGTTQSDLNTVGANVDTNDGYVGFNFGAAVNPGDAFQVDYFATTNVMTITNLTQSISQSLYVTSPALGYTTEYTFESLGLELTINSDFDDTTDVNAATAAEQFDTVASATAAAVTAEFQVGTGTNSSDRISVTMPFTNTTALGLVGSDVTGIISANAALTSINNAIDVLNTSRGNLGASLSRLEFAGLNIDTILENTISTKSALLDADVAKEITEFSSKQVLMQTAIDMLGRANERPNILLGLLK